ncbi:MAG: MFS transporter [Spirobacillus cienkowskii]|jgi:MFS family permease|uniref:MFS transporter n=1 Tax=Spirobacillus cienkowskii TaxID=495820 RepID=A0A369KPR1_9BACT|nr:MAG: MFS transporter [Spirobacillus cienkowskii]
MSKTNHYFPFLAFLVTFEFAVYMSNDMILPALIEVFKELNESQNLISLSLSVYLIGAVSLQLFIGPISDSIGRRPVFFAGGLIVLIGNLLGIFAQNSPVFFLARLLQGMGPCFISVVGYACVHELYRSKAAINVISWMTSITLFAPMIGPLFGSLVFSFFGWRYIFVSTFLLSFLSLIGIWFTMPETLSPYNTQKIQIYNIIKNYFNLLKNKNFIFGTLSYGLAFGAIMVWISSSPLVLMKIFQLDINQFSIIQIPVFLSFIIGTFLLRFITKFKDPIFCIVLGSSISFVGILFSTFFSIVYPNNLILLIITISIFNFGYGLFSSPFNRVILDSTKMEKGISSALLYFIFFSLGAFSSAGFSIIYNNTLFSFLLYMLILFTLSLATLTFLKTKENKL